MIRYYMKLNKKVIIFLIVIFIVAIIVGIYFYKKNTSVANDAIKENAYIDIWSDNSMVDIDLYSAGSGANEKLYLGAQSIHYLINKNGEVCTYQASSYKNKTTGKRDPATVEYIKTLSQSELGNLENDLKSTIESNSSDSISLNSSYWYIKIDGNSTRVNINVQTSILNKYL